MSNGIDRAQYGDLLLLSRHTIAYLLLAVFSSDIWWSRIKRNPDLIHVVNLSWIIHQIALLKCILKKIVVLSYSFPVS